PGSSLRGASMAPMLRRPFGPAAQRKIAKYVPTMIATPTTSPSEIQAKGTGCAGRRCWPPHIRNPDVDSKHLLRPSESIVLLVSMFLPPHRHRMRLPHSFARSRSALPLGTDFLVPSAARRGELDSRPPRPSLPNLRTEEATMTERVQEILSWYE